MENWTLDWTGVWDMELLERTGKDGVPEEVKREKCGHSWTL
jgi:hypothetical protein